eukprot:8017664-Karenia_brevis.AAC.1
MSTQASTWAAARNSHVAKVQGQGFKELKDRIILRSCPEELRIAVVAEFVSKAHRLPSADDAAAGSMAWQYLHSALGRRHLTTDSGEQLTAQQVSAWEAIFATVAEASRPAWSED